MKTHVCKDLLKWSHFEENREKVNHFLVQIILITHSLLMDESEYKKALEGAQVHSWHWTKKKERKEKKTALRYKLGAKRKVVLSFGFWQLALERVETPAQMEDRGVQSAKTLSVKKLHFLDRCQGINRWRFPNVLDIITCTSVFRPKILNIQWKMKIELVFFVNICLIRTLRLRLAKFYEYVK